jgi:hypothetical protein
MTAATLRRLFLPIGMALFLAGMVLNRGNVPIFSVSSLYYRYQELGLVKRGLLGTLLSPLLPEQLVPAAALPLWLGLGLGAGLALCLLMRRLLRSQQPAVLALALLSPAMFIQLGYGFYFLDLWCLICACLSLAVLVSAQLGQARLAALALLVLAGGLFHEVFLVAFAPLLLGVASLRSRRAALVVALSAAATALLLALAGSYEAGPEALAVAVQRHFSAPMTAAHFELTSSLATNIRRTNEYLIGEGHLRSVLPAYAYLAVLVSAVAVQGDRRRLALLAACLSPLALGLFAGDLSRWIGFACMNVLLLALLDLLPLRLPRWRFALLTVPLLAGPLGVVAAFPLLQARLAALLS